jgi:putative Mg2+ transporter-C (MgtC) family protein
MQPFQSVDLLGSETGAMLLSAIKRLALAAVLGGVIGLEREIRHKVAGLRTNMLLCIGAAMFTVLSTELAKKYGGDSVRIASQIIPGIGFIGAGAILRDRGSVTGLTTAATVFVTASIGMAAGGGFYGTAIFATAVALLALAILLRLEKFFEAKRLITAFEVIGPNAEAILTELNRILGESDHAMCDVQAAALEGKSRVVFSVRGLAPDDKTLSIRLHQSSVFFSIQTLGILGRE